MSKLHEEAPRQDHRTTIEHAGFFTEKQVWWWWEWVGDGGAVCGVWVVCEFIVVCYMFCW